MKAELAFVYDATSFVMQAQYFFQEQANVLENSKLKQLCVNNTIKSDNTSMIQLEQNRNRSSTNKTHSNTIFLHKR